MKTKPSRVLVIDDDESVRHAIAYMLRCRGLEVIEAESGERGIELALTANPSVILSDINMPNMDGFAVHDYLQKDPQTVSIPFIFITGWADCFQVAIQIKRGITVLQKPFDIERLMSCVVAHLD